MAGSRRWLWYAKEVLEMKVQAQQTSKMQWTADIAQQKREKHELLYTEIKTGQRLLLPLRIKY